MIKSTLILFFKGCGIGSADLVPGISGATIALVLNIYQDFVHSIKNVLSLKSLQLLIKFRFKELFRYGKLDFLLPIVLGIFTIIFSLSHLISFWLENHPIPFWSFFFGLILASAFMLPNYRDGFNIKKIFLMLFGILVGYWFISLTSFSTPDNPFTMFIAGLFAMSAMILPGISGSFVLVIIDKYEFLVNSIKTVDIPVLLAFALGGIIALTIFTRVIEFIFKKGEQIFIVFIAGFLIGSLKKIWPWQLVNPSTNKKVEVSPFYYEEIMQTNNELGLAILFLIAGIAFIVAIQLFEKTISQKQS